MSYMDPLAAFFVATETQRSPWHAMACEIFELPSGAKGRFIANLIEDLRNDSPVFPFDRAIDMATAKKMQVPKYLAIRSNECLYDAVPALFLAKHLVLRKPRCGLNLLTLTGCPGKTLFNAGYRPGFGSYLNGYTLWCEPVRQQKTAFKVLEIPE